jgi:hypothetical protein
MLKMLTLALPMLVGVAAAEVPAKGPLAAQGKAQVARPVSGEHGYIEYWPGNSPIIITAPHGGDMQPDSIPTREEAACGGKAVVVKDTNTIELAQQIRESFFKRYGSYPHVIVNHLSRRKLDPNRPLGEAACGSAEAGKAWTEWHAFIDQAKRDVVRDFGKGWYMDIHGHAHEVPRVEIGYLLTSQQLAMSDGDLNADATLRDRVSFRTIANRKNTPLAELLRGPNALGSIFEREGFRAVPSDKEPDPAGAKYFSAGYNTLRHGCSARAAAEGGDPSGAICGVQFETNYRGLRDTAENRKRFGDTVAMATGDFLARYYDLDLTAKKGRR